MLLNQLTFQKTFENHFDEFGSYSGTLDLLSVWGAPGSSSRIAIAIRKRRILIPFRISEEAPFESPTMPLIIGIMPAEFCLQMRSYPPATRTHTHPHLSAEHLLVLVPLTKETSAAKIFKEVGPRYKDIM